MKKFGKNIYKDYNRFTGSYNREFVQLLAYITRRQKTALLRSA